MHHNTAVNNPGLRRKHVDSKEVTWLLFAALVSLVIMFISTSIIPANPRGGLASDLFLAQIAAILAFYLIIRSRSVAIALACLTLLPTSQTALIYGIADSLDWMIEIL